MCGIPLSLQYHEVMDKYGNRQSIVEIVFIFQ